MHKVKHPKRFATMLSNWNQSGNSCKQTAWRWPHPRP